MGRTAGLLAILASTIAEFSAAASGQSDMHGDHEASAGDELLEPVHPGAACGLRPGHGGRLKRGDPAAQSGVRGQSEEEVDALRAAQIEHRDTPIDSSTCRIS